MPLLKGFIIFIMDEKKIVRVYKIAKRLNQETLRLNSDNCFSDLGQAIDRIESLLNQNERKKERKYVFKTVKFTGSH